MIRTIFVDDLPERLISNVIYMSNKGLWMTNNEGEIVASLNTETKSFEMFEEVTDE